MTAKQRAARAKFKLAVTEAKRLRKKNPSLTQAQALRQAFAVSYKKKRVGEKLGASSRQTGTSNIARDKVRKAKPPGKRKASKTAQRKYYYEYRKNRTDKPGKLTGMHKDTKSHNVNIRVVSGIGDVGQKFTRINNDVNGNTRYVINFLELLNDEERISIPFNKKYEYALKKAKKIGGRKFNNKQYGGGIVFQSYNLQDTYNAIQRIKENPGKIKI